MGKGMGPLAAEQMLLPEVTLVEAVADALWREASPEPRENGQGKGKGQGKGRGKQGKASQDIFHPLAMRNTHAGSLIAMVLSIADDTKGQHLLERFGVLDALEAVVGTGRNAPLCACVLMHPTISSHIWGCVGVLGGVGGVGGGVGRRVLAAALASQASGVKRTALAALNRVVAALPTAFPACVPVLPPQSKRRRENQGHHLDRSIEDRSRILDRRSVRR